MRAAPLPPNESARQRTLDALEVLDSDAETFSDAVAILAAGIAGVPISALTMVDANRLWTKSSCGLKAGDTPRDIAFCSHTILGTSAFVVSDLRCDNRFRENPLVIGAPYARFYAGFPLVIDGKAVGALCVIDDRPRRLNEVQRRRLTQLAAGAAAWLQARVAVTCP